jgi:hypothetical protein
VIAIIGAVTCDIFHCFGGGQLGLRFEDMLDRFDDNDRIVDDDSDRQHQREERDGIGREAERQHHRESPHESDRHRDDRDQRRAQVPEKDKDDDADEHKGLEQSLLDLVDHCIDEDRGVVHHVVGDVLGQQRLEFLQCLLDACGDGNRVGAGRLVDGNGLAGPAIVPGEGICRFRAELGTGDVLDSNDPAIRIGSDNDVVEFLDSGQPALRADVQLKLDLGHQRSCADAADGGLSVLRVDRIDNLRGGNVEARQAVQVEPDPHRVFEVAPLARIADPAHPLQGVDQVYLGVIRQEQRIARALWRVDRDYLQQRGGLLLGRDAVALHLGRQQGKRLVDPGGDVDGIEIRVAADLESDVERVAAVAAGG